MYKSCELIWQVSKLSNEPGLLERIWQRTWMETGHKSEGRKNGLSVMTSLGGQETGGGGKSGPSTMRSTDHWWFLQPRGHRNGLENPTTGLGHYRPWLTHEMRLGSINLHPSSLAFWTPQEDPQCTVTKRYGLQVYKKCMVKGWVAWVIGVINKKA